MIMDKKSLKEDSQLNVYQSMSSSPSDRDFDFFIPLWSNYNRINPSLLLLQEHRHHQPSVSNSRRPAITISGGSAAGINPVIAGIRAITHKAPLTIRPFATIYNPYSKSCSVLCNHPATAEIKNVVKHAKQSWVWIWYTTAKATNVMRQHTRPALCS